ncbi:LacI family DNA-binding transcriptional regulator [Methyloraptor flagellatus]|uniref:LacI family DNA-binding transcriptional regulator n=1 Tax=Methyloraptor flagellatus TaxID=3162530 RepID=A0AAU7XET7_9HYPH
MRKTAATKPATMKDVAARAGVSVATVSNVLADRKPVDAALVAKVRAAAAALGYQVDRVASQLRSGRARIVCVLVPSLDNPFFTGLIAAIERAVRDEGYDIVLASGHDDDAVERARLAALLSWRPAGVVVVPSTDAFAGRDLLEGARVPYVVVDRVADDVGSDVVTVDNEGAGRLAARHMLELGHRNLLVVASSLDLANIRERVAGIAGAYAEIGLPRPPVLEVGLSFEEIDERIDRYLAAQGTPTGVVALTNFATMGAIACLNRLDFAVPDDISVLGFDDYAWMRISKPSITAIAQPVDAMALAAWERLRARIDGVSSSDTPSHPDRLKLGCRLEIRQSARAVGPSLLGADGADDVGRKQTHAVQR